MTAPTVAVLDYGSGNVHSAVKALQRAGADARLTADPALVADADGLVVPGVGAFGAVIHALRAGGWDRAVDRRLAGGRPVLGICVGMQVMFERGRERGTEVAGLGQWPGAVSRLDAPILPHIGWNTVRADADSALFDGIRDERFYFVHSFAARAWTLPAQAPLPAAQVTWCDYGASFLAAVENGPLCATQFHPEKSGEAGIRLLANWIAGLSAATV